MPAFEKILVKPTLINPHKKKGYKTLLPADQARCRKAFITLADIATNDQMTYIESHECLLFLTTCRNKWYTLNAMCAECINWLSEGETENYTGYLDGLNQFAIALNQNDNEEIISHLKRAARSFTEADKYLGEFKIKRNLYFNKFDIILERLQEYCKTLFVAPEEGVEGYEDYYSYIISHIDLEDKVESPTEDNNDYKEKILFHLSLWFKIASPLTSLTRTYITNILGFGRKHHQSCQHYKDKLTDVFEEFNNYGIYFPTLPNKDCFSTNISFIDQKDEREKIRPFVSFCEDTYEQLANLFKNWFCIRENYAESFFVLENELSAEKKRKSIMKNHDRVTNIDNSVTSNIDNSVKMRDMNGSVAAFATAENAKAIQKINLEDDVLTWLNAIKKNARSQLEPVQYDIVNDSLKDINNQLSTTQPNSGIISKALKTIMAISSNLVVLKEIPEAIKKIIENVADFL
jgi:hypothetical protein